MKLQFLTEDIKVFLQMYEWNTHDKAQVYILWKGFFTTILLENTQ